jgi:uncharacterized iron-regulated membrane protein
MKLRPILFWSHLAAGVLAGLVILSMSVTGVLLTYERQIVDWVEQRHATNTADVNAPLSADDLMAIATATQPDAQQITLTYKNDPEALIKIRADRSRTLLVDPKTGDVLHEGESEAEAFFGVVTQIHRWFALGGDARATGRAITGYSNLLFLYLLMSGIYLWLPRIWNRALVRTKVFFNPRVRNGKARDFNWHHVFAFWSVIPLLVIVTTATVFYFPGVNELLYNAYGEEPPERRQRGSGTGSVPALPVENFRTNSDLLSLAQTELGERGIRDWKSIAMQAATIPGAPVNFRIDRSIGGQPAAAYNLVLDGVNGNVIEWRTFADNSPAAQARSNIRFLHTGEVLGIAGQTIAGLASLAASLLVWTGLALAWRRLIQPVLRRLRVGVVRAGVS